MKRTLFLLTLAVSSLAPLGPAALGSQEAAPAPEAAVLLRLHGGDLLWGEIEGHDAQRLSFRRLDNGGLVRLDWARLDPAHAEELLERFGYVDDISEEVMTEADRLILVDGTELIGKIVNRTETELWVKTANSTVPVPKLRLRAGVTSVQVPALDIYTREELYRQELAGLDPEDPSSQLALALFCERVFAFEQGLEHLAATAALDPDFRPEELQGHAARLRGKLANREQIEVLREVDHLRARGKFDQALLLASTFKERFPESPLAADALRKQMHVERSLERALSERVVSLWHHWARKLVRRAAMDPEMTFDAAVSWVDEGLSEEILTKVHEELARTLTRALTPEDVRKEWDERKDGRWQKAAYGEGTWLLGESEALAGLQAPAQEADTPKSERDLERERMAERIRRYMKNQEVIRKAKSSGPGDDGQQQKFWQGWTSNGRSGWLLAYYAEHGGDMNLRGATFRNCSECGGSGVREVINTGSARSNPGGPGSSGKTSSSGVNRVACPTCRNIGKWRTISFR